MRNNILIIKLSAIGDLLMASPSFAQIRKNNPGARITLLVGDWAKPVVENNSNLDEIISIDENIFWKKNLFRLMALLLKLRSMKFDKVYVMHWSNFFNFFAFLLGARERIGFDRFNTSRFLTRKVPFIEGEKGLHTIDKYLLLTCDNPEACPRGMDIFLTTLEKDNASALLAKHSVLSGEVIGLAPGGGVNPKSSMPSRCWPLNNFIELAKLITAEMPQAKILILGGKAETQLGSAIASALNSKNLINLCGCLSLRETAALMKSCKLLVANDSAPMHLASSVGTPVISIFGPTAPYDKAPMGPGNYYFYEALACSPCYKYGKFAECASLKCLSSIAPGKVFEKIAELIK